MSQKPSESRGSTGASGKMEKEGLRPSFKTLNQVIHQRQRLVFTPDFSVALASPFCLKPFELGKWKCGVASDSLWNGLSQAEPWCNGELASLIQERQSGWVTFWGLQEITQIGLAEGPEGNSFTMAAFLLHGKQSKCRYRAVLPPCKGPRTEANWEKSSGT